MKSFFIKNKVFLKYFFFILLLVLFDQGSKYVAIYGFKKICQDLFFTCSKEILPFFSFSFVCNQGVSFGMLHGIQNANFILLFVTILILGIFIYFLKKSRDNLERFAFLFIIGGACGNIIDRMTTGCVIDFLHFYYKEYHFPVFNIADSFVTIGGFLMFFAEVKKFYIGKFGKKI